MPSRSLLAATCLLIACYGGTSPPGAGSQANLDNPVSPPPTIAPDRAPVALAVLFNGNEIWCGNDEHESDPNATYMGALNSLRDGFTTGLPTTAFPRGSRATVIAYSAKVAVRYPMGDVRDLDGRAFGTQRDYRFAIGNQLMMGVDRAVGELEDTRAAKRVLVIVGDGNDTNNEVAVLHFGDLKSELARDGITAYALIVRSQLSPDEQIVSALTPNVEVLASPEEIPARLAAIWARL